MSTDGSEKGKDATDQKQEKGVEEKMSLTNKYKDIDLCTACTLLQCKTGSICTTCPSCAFSPKTCSVSQLFDSTCPSKCTSKYYSISPPVCPPLPLRDTRCPQSPLCMPKCGPSPLCNPCSPPKPCDPCCPPNPCSPCFQPRNPCNPCSPPKPCDPCCPPDPCGPCFPPRNPCNPCSPPKPCDTCCPSNPCSPCFPPRNPCNPCSPPKPCDPCCPPNPCSPCFPSRNPCNPCSPPKPCDPCYPLNPCDRCGTSNPCSPCFPPRNPCNPCSPPRSCNPCYPSPNPCNPCCPPSPCNPCNPASNPCDPRCPSNPCDPCSPPNTCDPCCPPNPCDPCCAPNPYKPCYPQPERPRNFAESISGRGTWQVYGVCINWCEPQPGNCTVWEAETVLMKLCVEVSPSSHLTPEHMCAYAWTNIKAMCNPCGIWKDIPLMYQPSASSVDQYGVSRYVYSAPITPTGSDTFQIGFNVRWDSFLVWASKPPNSNCC